MTGEESFPTERRSLVQDFADENATGRPDQFKFMHGRGYRKPFPASSISTRGTNLMQMHDCVSLCMAGEAGLLGLPLDEAMLQNLGNVVHL